MPVQMIVELSCNGSEASLNDCSWWTSPGYGYPQEVACDGEAGHTGLLASPSSKAVVRSCFARVRHRVCRSGRLGAGGKGSA